ncbi:MAG: hypothetical protein TR69_WS6001001206 [candidate division WS6 bacterium OLB20]|uniref:DUF4012 domain-containing protein n=1 Tax=candidate division WS6 bacterium OLB20 TaxID=1617426 RepID=A0A136LX27_9BACT|nr:MAG: hypothetical protein TR69_WS6001001206 [candidate division WS6 bacterium OLB20]
MANTNLRKRLKPKPQKTGFERFSDAANEWFFRFKRRFYFLRNITLTDFFLMLGGTAALGVIYFLVVSPAFSLARNVYVIHTNLTGLNNAVQVFDLAAGESRAATIKSNLVEAQQRTEELRFLFDLTQNHAAYLQVQSLLDDSNEFMSGFLDVFSALRPLQDYTAEYKPNIVYRFSDGNTLSASPATGSGLTLERMEENRSLLKIGVDRMEKARADILAGLAESPAWLSDLMRDDITGIDTQFPAFTSLADTYEYIPVLLGSGNPQEYLIVVQDNARYTAGGGEIAGFISVSLADGVPQAVTVLKPSELSLDGFRADQLVLADINLLANKDVTAENITLSDLALISDPDLRLKTVGELYTARSGKPLAGVIMLNLNVMERFLRAGGPLSYQQVEFTDDTLLSGINILLGDQRSSEFRSEIIMNLYARLIEREFNSFEGRFMDLFSILAQSRELGDIALYSDSIEVKNYILVSSPETVTGKDILSFGLNYDQESVVINKYPIVTINAVVEIDADFSTKKTVEIAASGVEALQNSYVCTPSGSTGFNFTGVTDDLVSSTFTADTFCNIFLEDEDLRYGVGFETIPFENSNGTGYNYVLSLEKNPGIGANYDIEFSFDPSLSVLPVDESFIAQGDAFIYSGVITGDKRFIFEISK